MIQHPSIPHLDTSPSQGRLMVHASDFLGVHITVTEKMDGEIATIYPDGSYHPRSLTYSRHWSRDIVKQRIPGIATHMKHNEMFVFENMYAVHTIEYNDLKDYLYLLFIVRDGDVISARETKKIAETCGLATPTVLWSGVLRSRWQLQKLSGFREGYVVRWSKRFPYKQLRLFAAKYVVEGFVQSGEEHWTNKVAKRNKIAHD